MARYNQTTPPLYNITNMRVPTVLVAGGNDWLGQWKVAQLKYLGYTPPLYSPNTIGVLREYFHGCRTLTLNV